MTKRETLIQMYSEVIWSEFCMWASEYCCSQEEEKREEEIAKLEQENKEAKEKLEDKREARDKEKLEKYIDNRLEYTSDCISLALTLASEAKLSFLEALEAQAELDEK